MNKNKRNPFGVTKAFHLSDEEINELWVDFTTEGGFFSLINPTSAMPMIIEGGKGSGKTHVMRYFSYPSQKHRHGNSVLKGINEDGYLGLYTILGGLSASRFTGKGKGESYWSKVFALYFDLWLAQVVLLAIEDIVENDETLAANEKRLCHDVCLLFSPEFSDKPRTIKDLLGAIQKVQRHIDAQVGSLSKDEIDIGENTPVCCLAFEIPKLISRHISGFKGVKFLYLIDEFEAVLEYQQKYINTLIRSIEAPSSIKVGTRQFGVKTSETLNAGETNKEGAEYELLLLDEVLRKKNNKAKYSTFVKQLCLKRIGELNESMGRKNKSILEDIFKGYPKDPLGREETHFILNKYGDNERPYFSTLRKKMEKSLEAKRSLDVKSIQDIDQIIKRLSFPQYPLVEKVNIFLFYQFWYKNKVGLKCESERIEKAANEFVEQRSSDNLLAKRLGHFKSDLLAQLYKECDKKQEYIGMDTFISMSAGMPRNLLIILKHVYQWAQFNDEQPLEADHSISKESQRKGLLEASDWFYKDAKMIGEQAKRVNESIERLATFLKELRYTDKPVDCSLGTFSVDLTKVSKESEEIIKLAEKSLLLINISGGQRYRNNKRVDAKYQLNPMLCPRWDLPISRRGAVPLSQEEVNAIFDSECADNFKGLLSIRVGRMTAPFFGNPPPPQEELF